MVLTGERSDAGAIFRVPAQPIEDIVDQYLHRLGLDASSSDASNTVSVDPTGLSAVPTHRRRIIKRVEIHARSIALHLDRSAVPTTWRGAQDGSEPATEKTLIVRYTAQLGPGEALAKQGGAFLLTIPMRAKFRGGRARLQSQDGHMIPLAARIDPALVKAISRAHVWSGLLATGQVTSIDELADRVQQDRGYVARVIRLAFLAPSIVASILDGRQAADMSLTRLLETELPVSWARQAAVL